MSTNRPFTATDWHRLDPSARRALIHHGFARKDTVGRWGEKLIAKLQALPDDTLVEAIRDAMRS